MRPFFVSVDGPKGVGKSTLISLLEPLLGASASVKCVQEKQLLACSAEVRRWLRSTKGTPRRDIDLRVLNLMMGERARVATQLLCNDQPVGARYDILLTDRWIPSDAVFRETLSFSEVLAAAARYGTPMPNLVLAAYCHPEKSWARANQRARGIDSSVIASQQQHVRTTERFVQIADLQSWHKLRTDGPAEIVAHKAASVVLESWKRWQSTVGVAIP